MVCLAFTECDHVFDSSVSNGRFSFPIIPSIYSTKHQNVIEEAENNENGDAQNGVHIETLKNHHYQKYIFEDDAKRLNAIKNLPNNIQCIYTFIGKRGERVKLEFTHFQLAGTADSCDLEYIDIYSELESPSDDLLSATLSGRYCGTVAPHVRVSLYNVLILVFHSRIGKRRSENIRLDGKFQLIPETEYIPGVRLPGPSKCSFLIDSKTKKKGSILSPTYPGAYPGNFRCVYLLKGESGQRIRLYFRDFDVYFGGEHCPYDALTVYDGPTNSHPILRKICGLQQSMEIYSFDSSVLLEFNTTNLKKNDPRGFLIDYEFSNRFVNVRQLIRGQRGISHILGTECDIRILSNRESQHYIESPNFPNMYPTNTTCTYILDGLQGDQNLEKVILTFELFSLAEDLDFTENRLKHQSNFSSLPESSPEYCSNGSSVALALTTDSTRTVLSPTDESIFDVILCGDIKKQSTELGPYTSLGPRIVVVFGSADHQFKNQKGKKQESGFRAKVEFKTDFGVPGEAMGDSNKCMFRFKEKRGSFNSPRYPANYPLDTNCTYSIEGEPGEQILLHFTQFALFEENSKQQCNDYLEISDVFYDSKDNKRIQLQAKHCWTMFPGPTVSTFGSHEMRVVFSSDSFGTANGFNAIYEIRKSVKENVSTKPDTDPRHCGHLIEATNDVTTGYFTSPGFPVKYTKDLLCDWEIRARPGHQILLQLAQMIVEGEMTEHKTSCMSAVIVIHLDYTNRNSDLAICGTNSAVLTPIVTANNSIRISFLTSPDKVNGLAGFNFTWTEIRLVKSDSECADEDHYLCSYTRLCIAASLRCNGDENCGLNDDTDEAHCNIAEKATDMRTILIAATFSGFIFLFIFGFFCFLFKKKLERKKQRKRRARRNTQSAKMSAKNGKTTTGTLAPQQRQRSGGAPVNHSQKLSNQQSSPSSHKKSMQSSPNIKNIDKNNLNYQQHQHSQSGVRKSVLPPSSHSHFFSDDTEMFISPRTMHSPRMHLSFDEDIIGTSNNNPSIIIHPNLQTIINNGMITSSNDM